MAFSDDFTGTNGQLLTARPGWSLGLGDDVAKIDTNRLGKGASTSTLSVYYRTDDGATDQRIKVDMSANAAGFFVFGSGNASTFQCYAIRPAGGPSIRVYKWSAGAQISTVLIGSGTLTDLNNLELRVRIVSGNPVLTLLQNGTQIGSEYTDTSGTKITSGRRGVLMTGTGALTNAGDNYSDNFSMVNIVVNSHISGFIEGVRSATPTLLVSGTYVTMAGSLQARVVDGSGNPLSGFDWTTKVATPSGNAFSFSMNGLPVGGPYTVQVRDSADTATVVAMPTTIRVGAKVAYWGQSQAQRLSSEVGAEQAVSLAANVFLMRVQNKLTPNGAVSIVQAGAAGVNVGSGIAALANQWLADTGGAIPLLLMDMTYSGTSINQWIDSAGREADQTAGYYLYGTNPTNGIAESLFEAAGRELTAVVFMQGTSNVSTVPGANPNYFTMMGTLGDKILASNPNADPLFLVQPYHRCCDPAYTWDMRQMQWARANSGGRWRHLIHMLDHTMAGDNATYGGVHQGGTLEGNVRMGTRLGRGLAALLVNPALDRWGPRAVSAQFTDATRTAFDVTFDKDIKLTDNSNGSNVPGQFVSEDGGTTWPAIQTGITADIVSARKLRITRTSSAFPANSRWDMYRGTPFNSREGNADSVGTEPQVLTNFLNRMIADTSSFDGGRGVTASPVMGTGLAIAAAAAGAVLPRTPNTLRLSIGLGL